VSNLLDTYTGSSVQFFGHSYPHTLVDKMWIKCGHYVVTCTCAIEVVGFGRGGLERVFFDLLVTTSRVHR
jgi:hypothetical protein